MAAFAETIEYVFDREGSTACNSVRLQAERHSATVTFTTDLESDGSQRATVAVVPPFLGDTSLYATVAGDSVGITGRPDVDGKTRLVSITHKGIPAGEYRMSYDQRETIVCAVAVLLEELDARRQAAGSN